MILNKNKMIILMLCLSCFGSLAASTLSDKIQYALEDYIYNRIEADSLSVSFVMMKQELPSVKDVNSVMVDVLWDRGNSALTGKATIPVQLIEDGQVIGKVYSTVRTRVFHRVWVSKMTLSRHQLVLNKHIKAEMRETTNLTKTPVLVSESIAGTRTTRVVGRSRILTADVLELPPVIRRGDRITVKLLHHNLEISLNATAKEDGWLGDRITVRDNRSRNELIAEVVSSSIVKVQY